MRPAANEEQALVRALEEVKASGGLSEAFQEGLARVFGQRFLNASRALEDGKVRRIIFSPSGRVVWVVSGRGRDYVILPRARFCSCEDFYFRVISHEEFLCYHLLAQGLGEALGKYTAVEEPDSRYDEVVLRAAREGERPRKLPIEDVENVRRVVGGVLAEEGRLPIGRMLEVVHEAGFVDLTRKHLVTILVADKSGRFRSVDGEWELSRREP